VYRGDEKVYKGGQKVLPDEKTTWKKEVAESLDRSVARSIDRLVARSLGFCSYFAGNKIKTRFGPAGDELQNVKK